MMITSYRYTYCEPYTRPIKELLLLQSKGETITREEKEKVVKYANNQRKKNQTKNK